MTARFREQPLVKHTTPSTSQPSARDEPSLEEDRQLDELVVHDLLNPMTGVLGQLELIEDLEGADLSEATRQRLQECLASARDLSDMLVDLRLLAQVRSEQLPQEPSRVPVRKLLDALRNEASWPDEGTVAIEASADLEDRCVRDCGGLAQRALHVIVRAALRLGTPRRAAVEADPREAGQVRVTCRYVGVTVPAPLRDQLWTARVAALQRQHGCRVDRARGLELVGRIMQRLGGAVHYEPTADGGMFVLTFPEWGSA